jgi:hypothetical protein
MAKVRRSRTKRNRPRAERAVSDDAVLRSIVADVRRLERHRETVLGRRMRAVEKQSTARRPPNARQLAQLRHRLHDAQLECFDVERLRCDIEGIIDNARAQLAALEVGVTAGMNAALVRYAAARATRVATAELEVVRTPRPGDFATELAKAKHATAIVIADRNKMRDALALLRADPERAADADEWSRELAIQEATVADLKQGLGLLAKARADRGRSA